MELDELKKSWNALDAQLQKEPIADEKQIKELIASYKTNTRHSLGRLVILQRFSLGTGAVGLAVILLVWFCLRFQRAFAEQDNPISNFHYRNYSRRYVVGLENLPLEQKHPHRRNVRSRSEPTHDKIPQLDPLRNMGSSCLDRYLHHTVLLDNGLLYTASHGTSRLARLLHHPGCASYLFHI